jgi:hypothetical protein
MNTTRSTNDQELVSLSQAVAQALDQMHGPLALEEFCQRVLAIRPSKAKNPRASLRNHLRWEEAGKTLVFLDAQTVLPLRIAMRGVRFRIPLSRQEVKIGVLLIEPGFTCFLRRGLSPQAVQLSDPEGRGLPANVVTVQQQVRSPFGDYTQDLAAFELGAWFRSRKAHKDDGILVTVEDWEAGRFRLEHEPAGRRRQAEIAQKNRELADILFAMLESARDERLAAYMAIPTAYARLSDPGGYPGDHWLEVLANDPRLGYDGWMISYGDYQTPLEKMIFGEEALPEESFTPAEGRQIYRFKAALQHRPGLWRAIEIQGEQTLADLDRALRDAFNHDWSDHMGGFWKRVRRGQSRKFREVDLGNIEPFGGGDGADRRIAGLGLEVGGELKYVYDFGDWIEHRLTLEQVTGPEAGAKYPRIVDQNKPRYQDCQSCTARGRKVRATWICIDCSNEQQREVLVCEKCLEKEHKDHYAEEIVY